MRSVEIPLTKGKVAIIDDADFDLVSRYSWRAFCSRGNWYAQTTLPRTNGRKRSLFMHRLLLNSPSGTQVDHRNGNGLDNRRQNLRGATNATNQMNRQYGFGASKFKGVSYNAHTKKWLARIVFAQRTACLGHYATEEMAALAYDLAAEVLFREFAKLNHSRSRGTRMAIVRDECLVKLQSLGLVVSEPV